MITQTFNYSLKKPLMRIHRFMPTFDQGLVLLYQSSPGKDFIMHITNKNEPIFTHSFDTLVDTLEMLNDKQVIVLLVQKNKIFILDLVTHNFKLYNHFYKIETSCQVRLFPFLQTKLMCICQNGTFNHNIIKLTYYQYPLDEGAIIGQCKPHAGFEGQEGEWTYEYTIRKANTHSMVLWFRSRHDDQFQIRTFDLRDNSKGTYRILKIQNKLGDPYGMQKINCALQEVWQMKSNTFCLVVTTDKAQKKCFNSKQSIINNFIWDVNEKLMRQPQFQLPYQLNSFQINSISSGQYCMFRSFSFEQGKAVDSPAIFIKNSSETIEASESGKVSYQSNWEVPAYSDCLFAEGKFDNYGVSDIQIVIRKLLPRKLLSYHLLVESEFGSCSQDLIGDSLKMLDYQS